MEESREQIEDFMRRYGYNEREAQAAYHLHRAWDLFEEMDEEAVDEGASHGSALQEEVYKFGMRVFRDMHFGTHFAELNRWLGMRVLRRDYPEGWGGGSQGEEVEE